MKIKQSPDDFRVVELTDVQPSNGEFSIYRLEKRGWTTHDVLNSIRRLWHLQATSVSYGGLKDRHAHTSQHLTIRRGPERGLSGPGWTLTFLGKVPRPFTSSDIRANRFDVVVRGVAPQTAAAALTELEPVSADGLANYFDDQRFGSISPDGDFVARRMVLGDWEGALRLALASPYEFDLAAEKRIKALLRDHWGDWDTLKTVLPRCHARSLVDYLTVHPGDFRGAVARLRPDLLSLYLSAYQSHLWNQYLAEWLRSHLPPEHLVAVRFKRQVLPMPHQLSAQEREKLASLVLPLPSARLKADSRIDRAPEDWADVLRRVLENEKVEWRQLTLRGMRRPFFSKGERPMIVRPSSVSAESGPDERHPGRSVVRLRFELPRGSYATLLVKRLFSATAM